MSKKFNQFEKLIDGFEKIRINFSHKDKEVFKCNFN